MFFLRVYFLFSYIVIGAAVGVGRWLGERKAHVVFCWMGVRKNISKKRVLAYIGVLSTK